MFGFDSGVEDRERDRLLQKAMSSFWIFIEKFVILKVWAN